jgi:uncharacterized protein
MQIFDGQLVYSATDLIGHGDCSHMTSLSIAHKLELADIEPTKAAGMAALAGVRGGEHEQKVLDHMKSQGLKVTDFTDLAHGTRQELLESAAKTKAALDRGDQLVYQGIFFDGTFLGYPDFLIRIDDPKYKLGYTYEVWDAKLKRSLSAHAVLQMTSYSRQLNKLGFEYADHLHAYLGDMSVADFLISDALPYLEKISAEYELLLRSEAEVPSPIWASKIAACEMCKWSKVCETGREDARDLSLVANLRKDQRKQFIASDIKTIEQLASASDEVRPSGISTDTFDRLRNQARLQAKQDADTNRTVSHEVFSDKGLALLPKPSNGDIWFDMEGDPFALPPHGLEYLFGTITHDNGSDEFKPFWAHSAEEEKKAFEDFVDWVQGRRKTWPDLHIYHYASYERTRITNLASRFATREAIIDDWLRNGLLVDLLKVVQQSIRVSQRSYSIKKLEPLYDFERDEEVQTAGDSVVDYENYLELMDEGKTDEAQAKLNGICDYNEADCVSTRKLDQWLREIANARNVPYYEFEFKEPEDKETQAEKEIREALLANIPVDPNLRNPIQSARAVLAAAMSFHRRESNVQWWEYFNFLDGSAESWVGQDKVAVVTSAKDSGWKPLAKGQRVHRREVTVTLEGGEGLRIGSGQKLNVIFETFPDGYVNTLNTTRFALQCDIDENSNGDYVIKIMQSKTDPSWAPEPLAVIAPKPTDAEPIHKGTVSAAFQATQSLPDLPPGPAFELLVRNAPGSGKVDLHKTGNLEKDITSALLEIDQDYIAVQGPPGTGKTYTTARVIKTLVENHGWRIGVVGQSHKVIENVLRAAMEAGLSTSKIAKEPNEKSSNFDWNSPSKIENWLASNTGGVLVGGTAWVFRRAAIVDMPPFDLIVIDEAGQFSLANTISMATVANRLFLVGDPQQLPQVSQASHPEPADESALSWLLGNTEVIEPEFGFFLPESYRMVTPLCEPVSKLSYRNQLKSAASANQRRLTESEPGLNLVPVMHSENGTFSSEEAKKVLEIVRSLIGKSWTDKDEVRALEPRDIKVVAPFNAQVSLITKLLRTNDLGDIQVGTVDRFQGQEAPVVIMSMATSSPSEVSRGLEFLLSRNRLNVAISRGQWATHLVYSPEIVNIDAKTPEQIRLISGFLQLVGSIT